VCIEISPAFFCAPFRKSSDSKWLLVKLIREYRSPARKERLCDQKKSSSGMSESKLLHAYDSIQQIFAILVPADKCVFIAAAGGGARSQRLCYQVEVINA